MEGVKVQIGQALIPILGQLATKLAPILVAFNQAITRWPLLQPILLGLVAAFTGMMIIGSVAGAVTAIIPLLPVLAAGIKAVWVATTGPVGPGHRRDRAGRRRLRAALHEGPLVPQRGQCRVGLDQEQLAAAARDPDRAGRTRGRADHHALRPGQDDRCECRQRRGAVLRQPARTCRSGRTDRSPT